ncbi:BamA/TamA family outer membrane protein [Mucilaginibacter polytrichastri]|uniref:Bacterial surface antigen (D15) domain-containing protein n=1 Tax=Mucilaginibacter polytrichastri TaxID=1302689 RepID=A0A1Q5ZZZ0_9SPHI|nr:BamA/TamA family outer membrane protein [Mucilaginibacter polytrichastri]OKS87326.1 hypothetical protein RG47T_2787 [Mucilaginibacter polytrichastri]SFT21852.1 Surface antigen [Mucilaginibacter polytrichastri]
MFKKLLLVLFFIVSGFYSQAQQIAPSAWQIFPDSVMARVHASYDNVSGVHRWLFGENFRKDWAMPVKLPLIKISQVNGGLVPIREGGGMQSKSLRLRDKSGREWVIRSVEKAPDKLLPDNLKGTFAVDWIGDEFSGQHPYSALIVPPLAEAANVPHANPVIGVMAADTALGNYNKIFTGMVCLLEEREPTGKSDNTIEMEHALIKSYENRFDSHEFLRARLLDLLIGDWDRHEDQWRWTPAKDGKSKMYTAVPRDRDQVFHVNQGVFPSLAELPWIDPILGDFTPEIRRVRYGIYKTRFMKGFPDNQFTYEEWMKVTNDFVKAETDDVLEAALKRLPAESYRFRHTELLNILKKRRNNLPAAMSSYYRFINRVVDIHTTDKDELFNVTDAPDGAMRIAINKLDKHGEVKGSFMDMTYHPDITKEIRVYVSGGDDHVVIDTKSSIKLRFIDSTGQKTYEVKNAKRVIPVYGSQDSITFTGKVNKINNHISTDSNATFFKATNPYNVWVPLATAALNKDEGFLLGLGFRYTGYDGFRKQPFSTQQELLLTHSFATKAYRFKYQGQWMQAVGKADFTINAYILAPGNTVNFFGQGNETPLLKFDDYRRFYRTRYNIYQFDPALRWHTGKGSTLSIGPSFQFYRLDNDDNAGRYITQMPHITSYDSVTTDKSRAHLGIKAIFISNKRNNNILPYKGYYFEVMLQGYNGLNSNSKAFAQIKPEFTYYQPLDSKGDFVLSDRVGGGISVGNPAFYQSMFLGGQGNLLGYLQYRFAGNDMLYNNFQARWKLADVASYILPGQLGITGFFDSGRVWVKAEHSNVWHTGTGGGLFFAPASLTVIQLMAGHSSEGWYPYISMNFRL